MKQGDLFGAPLAVPPKDPRPSPPPVGTLPSPGVPTRPAEPLTPVAKVDARSNPRGDQVDPTNVNETPAWRKPAPERKVLSVSELTWQLKDSIERKYQRVIVRGEVTGFRGANARGHLYFAIKDQSAQLDVKVWQSQAKQLPFQLRDGLSLIIEGSLNVYEVQGRYSLIAEKLEPEGVGARALAFEQLKAKLVKEGLIGEGRTKPRLPLPALPRRIGVVTSSSGAAWRDFLKVLHRRHPRVSVLFCNARVQGEDAPIEIARGIRWLSKTNVDVIVVTRGGGSVEDLWTFNEERVVRAIFASPVPVVSAVGHEIDVTLADLVADVRAPTPSAAAEAVVPVIVDLELKLATAKRRLVQAMERRVLVARGELERKRSRLSDPRRTLASRRLGLVDHAERLRRAIDAQLKRHQRALAARSAQLARLRPQTRLAERRVSFNALAARFHALPSRRLRVERDAMQGLRLSLERASPRPRVLDARRRLERLKARVAASARQKLERARERLRTVGAKLDALSPLAVLARGYAIASKDDGVVVRRVRDVIVGDLLTVRLDRGESVKARVEHCSNAEEE